MKATSSVRAQLNEMCELLVDLKDRSPHARANWKDWSGLGYTSGGGKGSGLSSSVESIALSAVSRIQRDSALSQWAEHDEAIETARLALRRAHRLAVVATSTVEYGKGAEGCRFCELAGREGEAHPNNWQEIYSRQAPYGIEVPDERRCSFHYDFCERWGVEAHREITLYHLDHLGSRVPYGMVREFHPDAFQRVQRKRAS